MANAENVAPQVWRGVARELRRLAAAPPAGVKLLLSEHDLSDVQALVDGPADTPYAGGVFRVRLALGRDFPAAPPRAYFLTRIFHPNVSAAGEVCVNTLKKDWRPELGLEHALLAVKCLLIAPNAESALNAEAAALLRDDYRAYCARAALYTDIHARGAAVGVGAGPSLPADPSPAEPALPAPAARVADDGPRAKRRAGGAGAAPAPARDRRRILKRL